MLFFLFLFSQNCTKCLEQDLQVGIRNADLKKMDLFLGKLFVFRKIGIVPSKNVRGGLGHFLALQEGPSFFFILLGLVLQIFSLVRLANTTSVGFCPNKCIFFPIRLRMNSLRICVHMYLFSKTERKKKNMNNKTQSIFLIKKYNLRAYGYKIS